MSFTNAPVTRFLVLSLVTSSIAVSLFDVKHYFYILIDRHLFRYHQLWRLLTYQLCYTNSSEVLFAAMLLYNMRVVERLWGPRKYATFIATTSLFTAFTPPVLLIVLIRPLTLGVFNYLPAGPTPIIFAILAQYYAMIPHIYKYRLAMSSGAPGHDESAALTFSDKSYRYLLAIQLALSQWPGSLLGAVIGWVAGYAWRNDLLPGVLTRWRIPGWLVGLRSPRKNTEFEGLRRRLEGESLASASASGAETATNDGDQSRRRLHGHQILDQVRGSF